MRELTATYRLQMNAGFTFAQAIERVEYLARLGISHLYLSPIFAARKGSMHGYDVVDPCRINPELGTEEDLLALSRETAGRGMGIILDVVPNHMGIGPENSRWDDVLTHGKGSRFARWFDIDWNRRGPAAGKVVLPVLGDTLDKVLERGELSVRVQEGQTPRVFYYEQSFPIDPATLPPELQLATFDPEETGQLTELFSGTAGRERMGDLLAQQHYHLVFWRRGSDEINYRRFFDVNELAALRVEDEEVFRESHGLILRLVADGVVDGLRIDHIDGLRDPLAYLNRLRAALPPGTPLFVEKILSPDEELRSSWPVDGTTGYEFMNDVEDIFLDPRGTEQIENGYRRMRRLAESTTFHSIARAGKVSILRGALHADISRLANLLAPILKAADRKARNTEVETAIIELIASLSVYRTYIDGHSSGVDDADRALLDQAREESARTAPASADLIGFIVDVLLDAIPDIDPAARLAFATRFQQVSGPAAAKGVEDTALYVYVPLVSRNEVGGGPDRSLDDAPARLHRANQRRAERWPQALIATNTHDTKRSADVRARLDALSELSHEWDRSLKRWRRLNARHRKTVNGRIAPDTNTEYLIYQTLVSLWPPPRPGRRVDDLPDRSWRDAAKERLVQYALKAAREAKTSTSWVTPASEYEETLNEFVAAILEPREDAPFLPDVARLVSRVAPIGAMNSLARVAIHLTAPGTPDVYQGDEVWNFTLVDPDNRAQVDFDQRIRLLDEIELLSEIPERYDNRLKLLVTRRLLEERRRSPALFRRGSYEPLRVEGPRAEHVFAFRRAFEGRQLLTIVPRLPCSLIREGHERWQGTTLLLPEDANALGWRSIISQESIEKTGALPVGDLLRTIPVAVLSN